MPHKGRLASLYSTGEETSAAGTKEPERNRNTRAHVEPAFPNLNSFTASAALTTETDSDAPTAATTTRRRRRKNGNLLGLCRGGPRERLPCCTAARVQECMFTHGSPCVNTRPRARAAPQSRHLAHVFPFFPVEAGTNGKATDGEITDV